MTNHPDLSPPGAAEPPSLPQVPVREIWYESACGVVVSMLFVGERKATLSPSGYGGCEQGVTGSGQADPAPRPPARCRRLRRLLQNSGLYCVLQERAWPA